MDKNYGMEEEAPKPDAPEGEEGGDENTFLAPKSSFGGDCKVGDTYTVKVVASMDDEIELSPVKEDKKPEPESDQSMESELSSMAASAPS